MTNDKPLAGRTVYIACNREHLRNARFLMRSLNEDFGLVAACEHWPAHSGEQIDLSELAQCGNARKCQRVALSEISGASEADYFVAITPAGPGTYVETGLAIAARMRAPSRSIILMLLDGQMPSELLRWVPGGLSFVKNEFDVMAWFGREAERMATGLEVSRILATTTATGADV